MTNTPTIADLQQALADLLDDDIESGLFIERHLPKARFALSLAAKVLAAKAAGSKLSPLQPSEPMWLATTPLWGTDPNTGQPLYGNKHGMINCWKTMHTAAICQLDDGEV